MEDALIAKVDFDRQLNRTLHKILTYTPAPYLPLNRERRAINDRFFMVYMLRNAGISYREIARGLGISEGRVAELVAKVKRISRRGR